MRHYVYYSFEEWGRGYIGCRSCEVPPEKDTYLGSFKDMTFTPKKKVILGEFATRKAALKAEIALHEFFSVAENPHLANRAKQTSVGFSTAGVKRGPRSEDDRKKISEAKKGRSNGREGYKHSEATKAKMRAVSLGQRHSLETRLCLSEVQKGKKVSEEQRKKISQTLKSRPRIGCPYCDNTFADYKLSWHILSKHREVR